MKKMKNGFRRLGITLALILAVGVYSAFSCEFSFEITKGKKEKYKVGDEIVVVVTLKLTHAVCSKTLKEVKFNSDGLKVTGAMEWVEASTGIWTRKLKIQIIGNAKGEPVLTVTRICEKDGGSGKLELISVVV
ncbi:MAG: hypothetical protein KKA07_12065 [Bacteroidetes bacterium]|nr:hypothetical protein [Bacteroidota bacterium]MBU1719793.1 hypothetical protein [Bacteroidota bacterium]